MCKALFSFFARGHAARPPEVRRLSALGLLSLLLLGLLELLSLLLSLLLLDLLLLEVPLQEATQLRDLGASPRSGSKHC